MSEKEKEELKMVAGFLTDLANIVPNLVKGVLQSLFSEEAGSNMGKAVGKFYKELREAGLPEQTAVEMTREYLSTLTKFSEALKGLKIGGPFQGKEKIPKGEEIGKRIEEAVEKQSEGTIEEKT